MAELGNVVPVQLHPGICPTCRRRMQIRRWSQLTFDVCSKHGCWVAFADRDHFLEVTASLKAAGA